jgi:hypothetical protein
MLSCSAAKRKTSTTPWRTSAGALQRLPSARFRQIPVAASAQR